MKKHYLAPHINVMMVETQSMIAASDPESYESQVAPNTQVTSGQITSNQSLFEIEDGEDW